MDPGDSLAVVTSWWDPQAHLDRQFYVVLFPATSEVEMVDVKSKRKFLKRTRTETVTEKLLFIGSSFNLHGRQLTVVDFANDHTRERLGKRLEKSCLVVYDVNEVATALQAVAKAGLQVAAAQMISAKMAGQLGPSIRARGSCVVMEVVGSEAVALTESIARSIPADASRSTGEAQDLIAACFGAGPSLPNTAIYNDTALLVIKAAAFNGAQAGDILADVRREGFEVTALQTFVMEQANAAEFVEVYKGVVSATDYKEMITAFMSGVVCALEVKWPGGSTQQVLRKFVGPADVEVAQALFPNSLRGKYGKDKANNAVHCTDLPEDTDLELEYFFNILAA